jgi:hypothetical protein
MYGTPKQIRELTGIQASHFSKSMTEEELDAVLLQWINHIGTEIDVRLKETILNTDSRYIGTEAVALRTLSKLVGYAIQNRTTKVVQIGDFAIQLLNSSDVMKDLDKELRPYLKRKITVFLSSEEVIENASTGG